ncbi:pilus assembly protein TadE [Wenjunlia vitaminophila]|uniref:Pilus assembly protein TadE n=1 Tax=Wenjunlia vitaminophila TaxID=76728 RepID=A0A0T6LNT0_WENVI|nr:TadE family type IV pilus minor pilin [Wenjunlia vitaminophila]KRV47577.1 pilus assembly protein TadE [Wenjunlia vitaminophila]
MRRSDRGLRWLRRRCAPRRRGDGGYVTAETAVLLPALVLLMAMLLWGVLAAAAQIRCVDAARAGARAAARSESRSAVLATAREAAPAGARVRAEVRGDMVLVRVRAHAPGPGRLAALLSVELGATATALAEDSVAGEAR